MTNTTVPGMYPQADQRVFGTQLAVCMGLGAVFFLVFCGLRARWPRIYAVRMLRKPNLPPLPRGWWGWTKAVYNINDDEILQHCGLDAYVFLGFFRMAIRIFAVCTVFAVGVIGPARLHHTGRYDSDSKKTGEMGPLLWLYPLFTYAVTLLTLYFAVQQTERVVATRQAYLGAQALITDRTISLEGIPKALNLREAIRRLLEDLGIGHVRDVQQSRDWRPLKALFQRRHQLLCRIEEGYSGHWGLRVDTDCPAAVVDTPVGVFTPPALVVPYLTELAELDKAITTMREEDTFAHADCAFVTMDTVASAQMAAQAVLDPRTNTLITLPAPAPSDVTWENLGAPSVFTLLRRHAVTLAIVILSVALFFPVAYLSTLINVKTISRFWPALGKAIADRQWATAFVTGLLPPYLFTLMNVCVPYLYAYLSTLQGYRSRRDEELSTIGKNFFYIFFNLFLVFTLAGTASNYWSLLLDTTQIAYQLAQSIKRMSLFYANLVLLQGVGMFPYRLLQVGDLAMFHARRVFRCSTPRAVRAAYFRPPVFDFGLLLPQPMLILIITLVYSVVSARVVASGLAYFVLGYFTYKYQLMYAMVHTQHSTGQVWPLIFRRVCLGLILFQLTMVGTLALEKAFVCAALVLPLLMVTLGALYSFHRIHLPLCQFIALRSILSETYTVGNLGDAIDEISGAALSDDDAGSIESPHPGDYLVLVTQQERIRKRRSTIDEERDHDRDYTYPLLTDTLDGPWLGFDGPNVTVVLNADGVTTITRKRLNVAEWE